MTWKNLTVDEIAGSAKEQSIAITQVDNVTQQHAATAEGTASAAQGLNREVKSTHSSVNDLLAMVGAVAAATTAAQNHRNTARQNPCRSEGRTRAASARGGQQRGRHDPV